MTLVQEPIIEFLSFFSLSFLHPWQHLRANHKYSCSDFPYYHTLPRVRFASLLLTSLACSTTGPNGSNGQRDTPLAWRTATHGGAPFARALSPQSKYRYRCSSAARGEKQAENVRKDSGVLTGVFDGST